MVGEAVPGLLDRRLIFVTGKGGVGKSTVATALGLLGARGGRRTVIAELSGQDRVRGTFGATGTTFQEVALGERLFTISIDPESAMEEYLRVKTGPLGQALGSSRVFQAFAMATPGMRELLTMGKVYELALPDRHTSGADPYDLVIVDAPAAGHGLGFLRTPRTFAEVARVGPIAGTAERIARTVADPALTAVLAVCAPEEMPVNETLWLHGELAGMGLTLEAVVVNALHAERLSDAEAGRVAAARRELMARPQAAARREASTRDDAADVGATALAAALAEHARARAERTELTRLRDGLGASVATLELPFLFAEALGASELGTLVDALAREPVTG